MKAKAKDGKLYFKKKATEPENKVENTQEKGKEEPAKNYCPNCGCKL